MAITFVAAATPVSVINGGTCTIDLTTITGLAAGDIVIFAACATGADASIPGGWTNIFTGSGGAVNRRLAFGYKFMGGSPDTSVTFWDTGGSTESGTAVAWAMRGVDTSTPLDGVTPTSIESASAVPNCPSIVPSSNDCAVIIAAYNLVIDASIGTVTNYTTTGLTTTSDDSTDTTICGGYRILSGGAGGTEDPAAWSTWTAASYSAATAVLRPAPPGQPIAKRMGGVQFAGSYRSPFSMWREILIPQRGLVYG